NFVALAGQVAQRPVAPLARLAEGRGVAHQGVDFFFRGRGDLNGGENQLELLDYDALGFEELRVVLGAEFFCARESEEAVELFPALQVVFHLMDEVIQFFVAHNGSDLASGGWLVNGPGRKKNDRAATQVAGSDFQTRK